MRRLRTMTCTMAALSASACVAADDGAPTKVVGGADRRFVIEYQQKDGEAILVDTANGCRYLTLRFQNAITPLTGADRKQDCGGRIRTPRADAATTEG